MASSDDWDDGWQTRPFGERQRFLLPAFRLGRPGERSAGLFRGSTVRVGSGADNDLVLPDPTVSRYHLEIVRQGSSYLVRDLESTNGTRVDGVRVLAAPLDGPATVSAGAVVLAFSPESESLELAPTVEPHLGELVGDSPAMRRFFHFIRQVAPTDATVLVEGETGTGKELAARTIHELSPRSSGPLVVVDCSALPATLLESELFGHERGSFSGALTGRKGLFEQADGGTVFLDEVGELPLELQPKLLRVLERMEVRRVGSNLHTRLDLRFVAATNRVLAREVENGRFRQDLFFRLAVLAVRIPPLRERPEDLPLLLERFFDRRFAGNCPSDPSRRERARALLGRLSRYSFPGNVRELFNLFERVAALPEGLELTELLAAGVTTPAAPPGSSREETSRPMPKSALLPFREAKEEVVEQFERDYLGRLVAHCQGNLAAAARLATMDRKHLRDLVRRHGLLPGPLAATDEDGG